MEGCDVDRLGLGCGWECVYVYVGVDVHAKRNN